MPIPVIIFGVIKIAGYALLAYELADLAKTAAETAGKITTEYELGAQRAKEFIRSQLDKIKEEIENKSTNMTEVAFLHGLTLGDIKIQSDVTKSAANTMRGSKQENSELIRAAIKQPIPFRSVIGALCAVTNLMPIIQLRDRKGIRPKDVLSKRKLAMKAMEKMVDVSGLADEVDVEGCITVMLKQVVLNFMFEFLDEMLDWKSPLKAEVSFGGPPPHGNFDDPPKAVGGPETRLKRVGMLTPFFPAPHMGTGSLSADIVIPDYRKEPTGKQNIFALIEVKFLGDKIKDKQFKKYDLLSKATAEVKTDKTRLFRTNGSNPVVKGFRVGLFRHPEDMPVYRNEKKPKNTPDKPENKPKVSQTKPKLIPGKRR